MNKDIARIIQYAIERSIETGEPPEMIANNYADGIVEIVDMRFARLQAELEEVKRMKTQNDNFGEATVQKLERAEEELEQVKKERDEMRKFVCAPCFEKQCAECWVNHKI